MFKELSIIVQYMGGKICFYLFLIHKIFNFILSTTIISKNNMPIYYHLMCRLKGTFYIAM